MYTHTHTHVYTIWRKEDRKKTKQNKCHRIYMHKQPRPYLVQLDDGKQNKTSAIAYICTSNLGRTLFSLTTNVEPGGTPKGTAVSMICWLHWK